MNITNKSTVQAPAETEHERSLRAVDPRGAMETNQPRMVLLEDDEPSLTEHAVRFQDSFIEPVGK